MKIKPEHYNLIKSAMEGVKDKIPAHIEYLKKPENLIKIKDFDMRLRWDWLRYAMNELPTTKFNWSDIYSYLNDDNIDTALKKIVGEIKID